MWRPANMGEALVGATLVVALPGPSIDAGTKEGTHKGCPYGFTRTTRKMGEIPGRCRNGLHILPGLYCVQLCLSVH